MRTFFVVMAGLSTLGLSACAGSRDGAVSTSGADCAIVVRMETTDGDIVLALDPVRAPVSVGNFLNHAAKGDYDGTCFHRVISTFVIQGGGWVFDPATRQLSDRGKAAKDAGSPDEVISNEWGNGLKNVRGTIAWARETAPDTATREFYFNVANNAKLDTPRETTGRAGYAVFGHVIEGMDVVDRIKDAPTEPRPDLLSDGEGLKDVPLSLVVVRRVVRVN